MSQSQPVSHFTIRDLVEEDKILLAELGKRLVDAKFVGAEKEGTPSKHLLVCEDRRSQKALFIEKPRFSIMRIVDKVALTIDRYSGFITPIREFEKSPKMSGEHFAIGQTAHAIDKVVDIEAGLDILYVCPDKDKP
ncbi:MAG: hypothetical protein M1814_001753 [Vezdaea aestivalis]|nr:MAG: hypothetical protein M1814_001753 [Vezdaea aestivalis]